MSTFSDILRILRELPPLEILEVCKLDEEPESLVDALEYYVEMNLEDVEQQLIANGLMEDPDEEV